MGKNSTSLSEPSSTAALKQAPQHMPLQMLNRHNPANHYSKLAVNKAHAL